MISARKGVLKLPATEGANCWLVAFKSRDELGLLLKPHSAPEPQNLIEANNTIPFRAFGPFKNPGAANRFAETLLSKGW